MLTLILLFIIAAILLPIGICGLRKSVCFEKNYVIPCLVFGIFFGVGWISSTCSLINRNTRFDYIKEQYNNLKTISECYDTRDKDRIESITLRSDVLQMNNLISEHKVKSQSPWVSVWYSKEVGDLKPITVSYANELCER